MLRGVDEGEEVVLRRKKELAAKVRNRGNCAFD
jgi:hypothetical protein